jgi:hypothetical protein
LTEKESGRVKKGAAKRNGKGVRMERGKNGVQERKLHERRKSEELYTVPVVDRNK